ncbi:MAG: hypothetical protein KAS23_16150, partial [Anaerohalosphaera sp.]|nr:hypothetical protein [Anaerohalosphaera sp.]
AVFIHGSNWCPVGEVVKKKVWDTTTLPTALKGGFILVSIDHPDNAPKNPEYEKLKKKNSKFNCRTNIYPAVFLLDKDARLYGQINGIQHDVNSSDLAEQMLKIHEKRKQRDSYWQKAESSTGIEKAELFGKGLDAIGVGLGHKGVYKPILEQIKKADPDDKSYYARKYTFNAGTYKNEALKLAGEKEFDQAIELLDSQIVHPGNKLLTSEQIQQIHMAKFHVYKSWPDHEEMRFDVCMDIIKLDPDTNLAVGAQGYYLYHQGPVTIRHGWQPRHIKNTNTSLMLGSKADSIRRYFPQSGSYDVILQFSRGDTLTVSSITLYVDGRQVDIDNHKQDASREAPKCIYTLNIPNISPTQSVQLKISCRSKGDKGSSGRIRIEPSEHTGSITVSPAVKQELAKLKDDLASQLKAYDDKLRKLPWKERFKKNALDQTYTNMLLQHELLRICTTDDLARLLSDSKGKQFFNILSEDSQWLEMLLCSGPFNNRGKPVAPHLVIEVLSEIYNSDPSLKDNRLYKILATAVAIETGTFDDPRIGVDRYNYYVESHKQSKLHPIFDKLETWEMRFVVNTGGKDDGSLRYLRDNYILPVNRYFGICWACPYRGYNVFGDTVQGPMYYVPWQNTMPRWQMIDINGGGCGSLSHFGTICAQAHGVPATAMGEPGHCAYTVRRKRGEWVPCYSLSGKRGVKHSFYRGTWQHINLMEEIFGDRKALLQASIHSFQGQLYRSDRVSPQVTAAYDLALDAHPIHFGIWRDYINMLNTDPATNYKQWVNLTKD